MSRPPPRFTALLTPPGRGAVAVVQVTGDDAAEAVDRFLRTRSGKSLAALPMGRVAFGAWHASGESAGEELIAVRRSERVVEVQCHGGDAAVEVVQRCLAEFDFEAIRWEAAFAESPKSSIQLDAERQLPRAATLRTAAILLDQQQGALACELTKLLARIHAGEISAAQDGLESLLARAPIGLHLAEYWRVAIAGEPNVGKSSLMNALVGYPRAIVHGTPGTTRDAVAARTASEGWPIEFTDTAGLRATNDPLEAAGIALARSEAAKAALVLHVHDASGKTAPENLIADTLDRKVLHVWNKCDLVAPDWSPHVILGESSAVLVSAATGQGIDRLLRAIVGRLLPASPPPGAPVPFMQSHGDTLTSAAEALRRGESGLAADAIRRLLAMI